MSNFKTNLSFGQHQAADEPLARSIRCCQTTPLSRGRNAADFDIFRLGEQFLKAEYHSFSTAEKGVIREFSASRWQADIIANSINVRFVDYQPYRSANQMRVALQTTGELLISMLGNVSEDGSHPFDPETNLRHRAVHDVHHCILGAGFNAPGEITASAHMINLARETGYPMFVQQFMFSEMIGQTGHFYATGGEYADQKVVLFQPELVNVLLSFYQELGPAGLIDYLTPIDMAAREQHGWTTRNAH